MSSLAGGNSKGFEKYGKILKDNFVFLNVYCRSVAEEHDPRGPKGPYQFSDRSVPVLVLKRWDGESLVHQLGFMPSGGAAYLKNFVDQALAKNGPVLPPKKFLPLLKSFRKGELSATKGKPAAAYKSFQKVITLGRDKKKYPSEPFIVKDAQKQIDTIIAAGKASVSEAEAKDSRSRKKSALGRLRRSYKGIPEIESLIESALEKIG